MCDAFVYRKYVIFMKREKEMVKCVELLMLKLDFNIISKQFDMHQNYLVFIITICRKCSNETNVR